MAVTKEVEINSTGVKATYWTVTRFTFDLVNNVIVYTVSGFLDEAARAAGKSAMRDDERQMPVPEGLKLDDIMVALYANLEGDAVFVDATQAAEIRPTPVVVEPPPA